ncbi:hypothetical protein [Methanobacterium subterraneum]|uniref:Uncharacterized protein n=2 Tax=Methanobacteriaceae TaxID=2159 RepID=A0A2H4VDD3_9EURY|nr:hypothetical protein [Methanobacterium subterraneum]AUB56870.1 hypothetical protein BK008_00105 [Methanobacterium sp. MZ-A1]MBW4257733.1 hypothetical protein [Methanobacterium sp. YSL]AUB56099.1 hypothetical protein BK007_08855 [Methanobacterium subterraneum]AUB60028.1 hypothetical protein BK009_04630 [Methanobacterium subterraneum]NMO08647.1 hypothetical protein [Methanobacterium subterraneum]
MKKDGILVSGIIAILICVVMASGCTNTQTGNNTGSGEKVIAELNLPKDNSSSASSSSNYNVTIPEGAKSVKIKYQGLQAATTSIGGTDVSSMATLGVFALNMVPTEGQSYADFSGNVVSSKSVDVGGGESDGTIEFNQTGIKGVFIAGVNVKGKLTVSAIT